MTTAPVENVIGVAPEALPVAGAAKPGFSERLDQASEWLNPILVKESRQALKSKQFVVTFSFMLLVTWIASIVLVTANWPMIYYLPYGAMFLFAYAIILGVPLVLVVPFSAFRSLAVEREDGTFELVSVTALSARQIITGKLGSAFAQIMVYCSAIAPCLVFTYLLRGVDLVRILFVIAWTIAISGGLCCVGLLAATFSRARYMQAMLSVGLLLLLLFIGFWWIWVMGFITIGGENLPWGDYSFWALMGYLFALLVCLSITCVLAASAQISFASDNHATPVRVALFFTQAVATGGFIYLACLFEEGGGIIGLAIIGCLFWALCGSLMIGDSGFISERVRRQLPASLFGRAMFSWFNPGASTAYVFTCVTMTAGIGGSLIFCVIAAEENLFGIRRNNWITDFRLTIASALCILYVIAYLGATNLILAALRRYFPITPVVSFIVAVFVGLAACLLPLMAGIAADTNLVPSYGDIQAPNWAWTIMECLESGIDARVILIVALYAGPIFMINVLLAYREIAATKTALPTRVIQDERVLHPVREVKPQPQNPWDEVERPEAAPEGAG